MGVIEEILRIRDEATPVLRGVSTAADGADKSIGSLNERLRLGQDAARALGGRYGEMAERANNLGKVLSGLGGGAGSVVGVLGATFIVSAAAAVQMVSAINSMVRSAAEAAPELERLGLITSEQAEATGQAARQLEAMEKASTAASSRLVAELAPALTDIYRIGTQTTLALADLTGWLGEQAAVHPTLTTGALDAVGGLSVLRRTLEGLDTVTASYREQAQGLAEDLRTIEEDAKRAAKSLADNSKALETVGKGNLTTIAGGVAGSAKDNERAYKDVTDGWKRVLAERTRLEEQFREEQSAAFTAWFDSLAEEASKAADQARIGAALVASGAQSPTVTADGIPAGAADGFGFGSSATSVTRAERTQAAFDRAADISAKTFDVINATLPVLVDSMGPEGRLIAVMLQLVQGFLGGAAGGGGFAGGFAGAGNALASVGVSLAASAATSGLKSGRAQPLTGGGISNRGARQAASQSRRAGGDTYYISGVVATDIDQLQRELDRQITRRGRP